MNNHRRDIATVLVRFAGVYFAYLAAKKVFIAAYGIWYLFFLLGDIREDLALHQKTSLGVIIPGLFEFVVTAGIAYYLLRKGKWLIEFISKDSTDRNNQVEPDGSGQ